MHSQQNRTGSICICWLINKVTSIYFALFSKIKGFDFMLMNTFTIQWTFQMRKDHWTYYKTLSRRNTMSITDQLSKCIKNHSSYSEMLCFLIRLNFRFFEGHSAYFKFSSTCEGSIFWHFDIKGFRGSLI